MSQTQVPTSSVTISPSFSSSPTQSTSLSQRATLSISSTPTQSVSSARFVLSLIPSGKRPFNITSIVISDSHPAQEFEAAINACPPATLGLPASLSVTCSLSRTTDAFVTVSTVSDVPCTRLVAKSDLLSLPITIKLRATFGCGSSSGLLYCSARQGVAGPIVSNATLSWTSSSTLWPMWNDAVLVSSFGVMRSVSSGIMNATTALLEESCASSSLQCSPGISDALLQPQVVIAAAAKVLPLLPSQSSKGAFTLTLTGPSLVSKTIWLIYSKNSFMIL